MNADLVTGATGCLGRYLVKALLSRGRRIICAVRRPESHTNDPLFQSPGLQMIPCDFTTQDWQKAASRSLSACENVFHLAGEMPHRPTCRHNKNILRQVNFEAVKKLYSLSAEAGVKRFIYVSSVSVYGDAFAAPKDETSSLYPQGDYSRTKAQAEQILIEGSSQGGPAALIIRPGLIYGDHDNGVIQKIISLIQSGFFFIPGSGENIRSLTSASLAAEVLCSLAGSQERRTVLDVVDARSPTLKQLTDRIAGLLQVPSPRRLPLALVYPAACLFSLLAKIGLGTNFKISDIRKISTSNIVRGKKLESLLGSVPDYQSSDLTADVAWFQKKYKKN